MNQEIQDKKNGDSFLNLLTWFAWWKVADSELEQQVNQYNSLGITKSFRGISVLIILGSLIFTTAAYAFGLISFTIPDTVGRAIIYLPIAFYIYRGKRWAMLLMMALWTVEKAYSATALTSLTSASTLLTLSILFWWSLLMRFLYAAYKVEGIRQRSSPIINPEAAAEQQAILPDSSKTSFTKTAPKRTGSFKGIKIGRRTSYVLVIALFLGSAFYWYEIRPAKIKHDCSWRKEHIEAIAAQPAKSPEEVYLESGHALRVLYDSGTWKLEGTAAKPSQPARDEWRRMLGDEYEFCLHDHGL